MLDPFEGLSTSETIDAIFVALVCGSERCTHGARTSTPPVHKRDISSLGNVPVRARVATVRARVLLPDAPMHERESECSELRP